MTAVNSTTSDVEAPGERWPPEPYPVSLPWHAHLTKDSPAGIEAQQRLLELLLRATRRQVWRLRGQLPGAGAGELEDLAQQSAHDAMIAVLRKLDTFEGRSQFTTWVYKFGVLHAGVACRRQGWRHREVALPESLALIDPAGSPTDTAEASDLAEALERAIADDLTVHQRRVAIALLVEQVPIDVLAERLGTTRNALYKTLHDARQRLRRSLTDSGHIADVPTRSTP